MTFEARPTYAELASIAPISVRKLPVVVQAMYFAGGAEQATRIIDWILLNDGTASWTEAYEGEPVTTVTDGGEPLHTFLPGDTEHLKVRTLEGTMRAKVGSWIIQGVEGEFHVVDPSIFRKTYGHL